MLIIVRPSQRFRTLNNFVSSMLQCKYSKCMLTRNIKVFSDVYGILLNINVYTFVVIVVLSSSVNSNTTNMNVNVKHNSEIEPGYTNFYSSIRKRDYNQNTPHEDYDDHEDTHSNNADHDQVKVNLDTHPYYSEQFINFDKVYNGEHSSYSNYDDYKKFYLNPSKPISKSNVKFKISSRIVQTKYGKLQGIVLGMDEHRYLKPLEVFLGVPYATPPVGSNR